MSSPFESICVTTSDAQFGFKSSHGTDMTIFFFKIECKNLYKLWITCFRLFSSVFFMQQSHSIGQITRNFSIYQKRGISQNIYFVLCPSGTQIKNMLSDGVMHFHRTSIFLMAIGREVLFLLYLTFCIRKA